MIQLILDGCPAVMADDTSIKLTVENPFYTDAASYTQDIELPIDIEENREIFGNISRHDVSKRPMTFDAELRSGPHVLAHGVATVTTISESSVSVQFLGDLSAYNFKTKVDDQYVDELDMGSWYEMAWPDRSYFEAGDWTEADGSLDGFWAYYPPNSPLMNRLTNVLRRSRASSVNGNWHSSLAEALSWKTTPFTFVPFYNQSAGRIENSWGWGNDKNGLTVFTLHREDATCDGEPVEESDNFAPSRCLQPYLWAMAEKVAEASGLALDRRDNALYQVELYRHTVCVSGHVETAAVNKAFPHWTVGEWWTRLQEAFNLVMTVDYTTKRMRLARRQDYFGGSPGAVSSGTSGVVVVDDVDDEFHVDVSEEKNVFDLSSANVGFDADYGFAELLPDEILKQYPESVGWRDVDHLADFYENLQKDMIYRCDDGRTYIRVDSFPALPRSAREIRGLMEVDTHRPRFMGESKEKVDVSLKFVPCGLKIVPVMGWRWNDIGKGYEVTPVDEIPVLYGDGPDTLKTVAELRDETFDIEEQIKANESKTEDASLPDVVWIAYIPSWSKPAGPQDLNIEHWPHGCGVDRSYMEPGRPVVYSTGHPYSLGLNVVPGVINLATETLRGGIRVDTRVLHCFRFISETIPAVDSVFIIRNKKYVCQKIEADITNKGVDRLITGYFYEVSD